MTKEILNTIETTRLLEVAERKQLSGICYKFYDTTLGLGGESARLTTALPALGSIGLGSLLSSSAKAFECRNWAGLNILGTPGERNRSGLLGVGSGL